MPPYCFRDYCSHGASTRLLFRLPRPARYNPGMSEERKKAGRGVLGDRGGGHRRCYTSRASAQSGCRVIQTAHGPYQFSYRPIVNRGTNVPEIVQPVRRYVSYSRLFAAEGWGIYQSEDRLSPDGWGPFEWGRYP